jgi:curli biogenesis system outer membrane secretion channel CsgG
MSRVQSTVRWHTISAAALVVGLLAPALKPLEAQAPTRKPTVAVIEFDIAAMMKKDEFAPMSIGIQVMLTSALAANPGIELVERQKIQEILAEQNLTTAGRIDPATAAKVGKILGARYVLLGAMVVDPSNEMRL